MKDGIVYGGVGIVETVVTVSQTNEVFQTVQIIISAVAAAVALAYTIWKWYKNATKEDSPGGKKITKDEVVDLVDQVKDSLDGKDNNAEIS